MIEQYHLTFRLDTVSVSSLSPFPAGIFGLHSAEKMRLLLLATHYWERGGIEAYVQTVERAARDLGVRVDVLTVSAGWIPSGEKKVVDVSGGATRLNLVRRVSFLIRFLIAVLSRKYDAILCAHPYLSPLPWVWKKVGGTPYVVFSYGIEVWDGLSKYRRQGLVAADRVATISTYTAARLVSHCGVDKDKIRMLSPCVPGASLSPLATDAGREVSRQRWGLHERKVILTVGRQMLSEGYKGADLLIRAMHEIGGAAGDVVCIVAGGGDGHAALRGLADEAGVGDKVRILGAVSDSDLIALYDACDVFVLASVGEGFGIVLLEAAARGRPSVGLRFGGVPDAISGGRTGVLVDKNDPADLSVAVASVLNGQAPDYLYKPQELRRIVVDNFGFDRFKERFGGILGEILPAIRSARQ